MTEVNDLGVTQNELDALVEKNKELEQQVISLQSLLWLSLDKRGPLRIHRTDMLYWDRTRKSLEQSMDPETGTVTWKAVTIKENNDGNGTSENTEGQPTQSNSDMAHP